MLNNKDSGTFHFKMAYLVTGGAGFIGSHVVKALLDKGEEVVILDDFNSFNYAEKIKFDRIKILLNEPAFKKKGVYSSKKQKLTIYHGDIRNEKLLDIIAKKHEISKICHLAARAGVRRSLQFPRIYYDVNVLGTLNIFEMAVRHKIKTVVYASSSSVYGGVKNFPFKETEKVDSPISPYASTKKACEEMAAVYHYLHGINMTGLRFFTVYGPWGRPDMALYLFSKMMLRGEKIPVYNQGNMQRDFTYIADIVQGVLNALEKGYAHEIFNLANAKTEKLSRYISILENELGIIAKKEMLPIQQGDIPKTSADIGKANKKLGYNPTTNIDQGIKKFIEWFKEYHKEEIKVFQQKNK